MVSDTFRFQFQVGDTGLAELGTTDPSVHHHEARPRVAGRWPRHPRGRQPWRGVTVTVTS